MGNFYIVTPTYNNGKLLNDLYKSLVEQRDQSFTWIIIDDGSTDDTKKYADKIINEKQISTKYIYKLNGGKSSALNVALDYINKDDFLIIIDADEILYSNAVVVIKRYILKYESSREIGVIHFNRVDRNTNKIISKPVLNNDMICSYHKWKSKKMNADGYIAYFGFAINDKKFPIYNRERYIAPGVMIMRVCEEYDMLWSKEIIGSTIYQDCGITKQGRTLRLKNPISMIYYCVLLQNNKSSLTLKLKGSIIGFAYQFFSKLENSQLIEEGIDINKLNIYMRFPGFLLYLIWKGKYKK